MWINSLFFARKKAKNVDRVNYSVEKLPQNRKNSVFGAVFNNFK